MPDRFALRHKSLHHQALGLTMRAKRFQGGRGSPAQVQRLVGEAFAQAQDVALSVGEPRPLLVGPCNYVVDRLERRGVVVEEARAAAFKAPDLVRDAVHLKVSTV